MKLIQAMKKCKDLAIKAEDLRKKTGLHCADYSIETPVYGDQRLKIAEWLQAHGDILKEILALRVGIQRTNLATPVTIELDGKQVTKCIAEWIHRRRDLANLEQQAWGMLTDRGLKHQQVRTTPDGPVTEVGIRRYFSPEERDQKMENFRVEPSIIDATLEVVNATTDLME